MGRRFTAYRRRRRGYTFLDMVITVMILGILTAAAAPKFFNGIRRLRVDSAAKRIALDLKYARRQAKMRNGQETVSFDVPSHRYALSTAPDLTRRANVYTVNLRNYPYETQLASVDFNGAASVTFNAFGAPNRAGQIVVRSGAHQKTITVAAGSGDVTIQ